MTKDKGLLNYHGRPQREYLYGMLSTLCRETFISCNDAQSESIDNHFNKIIDAPAYAGHGPMAGILSAFDRYEGPDWLVVGCDYPYITRQALNDFLNSIDTKKSAAAFYNDHARVYEPLLAWYAYTVADELRKMAAGNDYSLQHFLRKIDAGKYRPADHRVMRSIDTLEEFEKVKTEVKEKK
jgi:molybdopterin-guanine dinucleotide biosynthesis protein A